MVDLAVSIDGAASAAFDEALKRLGDSLGSASCQVPRRAAIQLCKNFRAGTRQAKKNRAMVVAVSDATPKWITYKDGRKLAKPIRRWRVTLSDRGKTFDCYVEGEDRTAMKRELRRLVGTNYFPAGAGQPSKRGGTRGLAKRSWGWVMHNIFSGASPDTPWQRRKNDKRNPKDATGESYSREDRGTITSGGVARICNRLDYIRDALTIDEGTAIRKAASAIVRVLTAKQLRKQGGMTSAEIKSAAAQVAEDFKREFPS